MFIKSRSEGSSQRCRYSACVDEESSGVIVPACGPLFNLNPPLCVCERKAGVQQRLGRYLMMERKRTYLKTDLDVPVVNQWRMSQRMNMDKNRIISSSAFDGYRQACKCRT